MSTGEGTRACGELSIANGYEPATLRLRLIGLAALAIGTAQVVQYVMWGQPYDVLWLCNVACPLLGIACLIQSARVAAVSTSWLCFGLPIWLLDKVGGGKLTVVSVLVHVVGLLLGALSLRELGWRRGAWVWASALILPLWWITRLVAPPYANVNLTFRVWTGWETLFPSHALYLLLLFAVASAIFFVVECSVATLQGRAGDRP